MRLEVITRAVCCLFLFGQLGQAHRSRCRNLPGDEDWPSHSEWAALNNTVRGRLIATIPQASVCHQQPFHDVNETACQILRKGWDFAQTFEGHPAEIANPAAQNASCDPFTSSETACDLGNYAVYAVNVTGVADVVASIGFCIRHNVRLVIKNTGHDYMGKSTGKGSLSLWTHNLKDINVMTNYRSAHYVGPAVKMGAGVISGDLYAAVAKHGYRAVGGTCGSVGVAGGYSAGGGHSLLNGLYGMAADNVLEWEVITADGRHVTATPSNDHADLYWAMSGGGGGTWGVVLSMTAKLHRDSPIGGATLAFAAPSSNPDAYWEAVQAWHAWLPSYVDGRGGGNTVEYQIGATSFAAVSFTVPSGSRTAVDELVAPYLASLTELGIAYKYSSHTSCSFYEHFEKDFGPLPYGPLPASTLWSNRLFPRVVVADPSRNKLLTQTIRNMTEFQDGYFFLACEGLRVNGTGHQANSVLPAWRDTIGVCGVTGFWNWTIPREEMMERKRHLAFEVIPSFEAATPGSGTYLNEVDSFYIGDWKKEFYGANYNRLAEIKAKYDPEHVFYAYSGVGSDSWEADSSGRLCRV